jgi:hypothetical protein
MIKSRNNQKFSKLKLKLNQETVRIIGNRELAHAAGGSGTSWGSGDSDFPTGPQSNVTCCEK